MAKPIENARVGSALIKTASLFSSEDIRSSPFLRDEKGTSTPRLKRISTARVRCSFGGTPKISEISAALVFLLRDNDCVVSAGEVMKYPQWFPYPSCWLRVLISLVTIALPIAALQRLLGDSGGFLAIPLSLFVLAFVRQLVALITRDDAPSFSWNPPRQFWYESIVDLLILIGSVGLLLFAYKLVITILFDDPHIKIALGTRRDRFLMPLWLVVCCYFHHVRYFVRQYFENRRKRKTKQANQSQLPRSKRPARTVEDSDRDLNELRWQERQRHERRRVSRSSPPSPPPPSSSRSTAIDDELERLKREMEDKNKP